MTYLAETVYIITLRILLLIIRNINVSSVLDALFLVEVIINSVVNFVNEY